MSGREVFRLLAWARDIGEAHRLAAGHPVHQVDIGGLAGFAPLIHVNPAHLDAVDLAAPILIAPVPELGNLVIDGWHRIHRALRDGVTVLPARMLSETDEQHCRIQPAGRTDR